MIPPNFNRKYLTLYCRRFAPTLFPHWGNNRAADSRPYAVCATELPGWIFRGVHSVFYAIAVDEPITVHVVRSDGFASRPQLDIYPEYQDFYRINIHLAFGLIHRIHEYTQRF